MIPLFWQRIHSATRERMSRTADSMNSGFCYTLLKRRLLFWFYSVLSLSISSNAFSNSPCWTYHMMPDASTASAACFAAEAVTPGVVVSCSGCGGDPTLYQSPYGQVCFAYNAQSSCTGGGWVQDYLYPKTTLASLQAEKSLGQPKPGQCAGNPCNPANGNKYQPEEDRTNANLTLSLTRSYNSLLGKDLGMGFGWSTPFHKRLEVQGAAVQVRTSSGQGEPFSCSNNICAGDPDSLLTLTQDATGYTLTQRDKSTERYNINGKLQSETNRAGQTTIYNYEVYPLPRTHG